MHFSHATWRKSSLSTQNGSCVEVATVRDDRLMSGRVVAVRDSKNPSAPALALAPEQWRSFTGQVKAGAFELA
jgi:hypothetical protein